MEIAAGWVVIVHSLAAIMFGALAGLLVVSNRLGGRAGVLALSTLALATWNASLSWTSFGTEPRAVTVLEALQVICWLPLVSPLTALIGPRPVAPVLRALVVAGVGLAMINVIHAAPTPLYVDAAVAANLACKLKSV